jgi:ATP synthase protein I
MSLIGPEGRKQLQLAARFATAGLELSIAIVVGYFGGRAIDGWLETTPYGAYGGLVLGIIAGFRNLFSLAKSAEKLASSQSADSAPDSAHANVADPDSPHDQDPRSPNDSP